MKRLVLELGRYGRLVFGSVLVQDESLRCKEPERCLMPWTSVDGEFTIESVIKPELSDSSLFLRGENTGKNNKEFYYLFDTVREAIQCVQYIHEGVAAINAEGEQKAAGTVIELERIE